MDDIAIGKPDLFIRLTDTAEFHSWTGLAAEMLCYEHRYELSKLMGFSDVDYNVGPYFKAGNTKNAGMQIDLIYDRKDGVMTVCEIKYRDIVSASVLEELQRKLGIIPNPKKKTLQKALILKSEAPESIKNRAFFSHFVLMEDLCKV